MYFLHRRKESFTKQRKERKEMIIRKYYFQHDIREKEVDNENPEKNPANYSHWTENANEAQMNQGKAECKLQE